MNNISCDTCLDLIPLVKDGAASEDSKELVKEHMEECQECKELYDTFTSQEIVMDDSYLIAKIRKRLLIGAMTIIVIASMLGLALSETIGMFYNILIMPAIGMIGYFALGKRAHFVPISLFIFSYVWLLVKYIAEGMFEEGLIIEIFTTPFLWAGIYAGLCALGVMVGFLFKYAFGKEKKYEI